MVQEVNRHILIVDDDELVSAYLGALLESENYRVTVLNDPREAISFIQQNTSTIDLIITDQVMPELTGVQLARAAKAIDPEKPVVMITGFSDEVNEYNARDFGLSGFFAKSINEDSLLARVNDLVVDEQAA